MLSWYIKKWIVIQCLEIPAKVIQLHLLKMGILVINRNNLQRVIVGFPLGTSSKNKIWFFLSLLQEVHFDLNRNWSTWVSFRLQSYRSH